MAKKQKAADQTVDRKTLIRDARTCACRYLQVPSGVGTSLMKRCTDAELQAIVDVQKAPLRQRRQLVKAILTRVTDRANAETNATKKPVKN